MYGFTGGGTVRMSARPAHEAGGCPDPGRAPEIELRGWLEQVWGDSTFADAVELASPALATGVRESLAAGRSPCPRTVRRTVVSVLRYRLRSTSRATPFGLFAGVATLDVGKATTVRVGDAHRAAARVDHRWIAALVEQIERRAGAVGEVPVVVDGRAVVRDGRLVLTATPPGPIGTAGAPPDSAAGGAAGGATGYREVSVRYTTPVAAAVRRAREPVTRAALCAGLAAEFPAAPSGAVDGLIAALVREGFLVGALHPPMTVPDPLTHLVNILATHTTAVPGDGYPDEIAAKLWAVTETLARHDATTSTAGQRELRAAALDRMRALAGGTTPLGVDLVVDADIGVPAAVADEAAGAAAALVRLAVEPHGPAAWRDYHRRFLDRYGVGAVVAVPELLHTGTGLGYPVAYRGSHLPPPPSPSGRDAHARRRAELCARLAHDAAWDHRREVEITDTDLDALTTDLDLVPQPHTDLRAEVHAPTRAAVDAGRFDLVVVGASRAGGTITGRFLDLLDPTGTGPTTSALRGLPTATRHAIRVQLSGPPAAPDAGTITRSAPVLERQLVVGGHAPPGSLLPADVAVSGDRAGLYLVLAATGEPVEPTTFTALELVRCADPTLRFLAEITTSACTPCSPFIWDPAVRELPFLPRLRYRRTLLTPARWTLRAADLSPDRGTTRAGTSPAVNAGAWRTWQDRWAVPDRVLLGQHDQRLGLDLAEPAHRHLLGEALHRAGHLTLLEAPAADAFDWIDGRAHELVLPLTTTTPARHPARPRPTARPTTVRTAQHTAETAALPRPAATGAPWRPRHTPGTGTWISAHLACRPDHQTLVLTEHLPALLTNLDHDTDDAPDRAAETANGSTGRLVDGDPDVGAAIGGGARQAAWFLRLTEPDHHLRLRLRLGDRSDAGRVIARVAGWADQLTDAGLVGGCAFHPYRPETGRYGTGAALFAAEEVFAADSTAVLAQLATQPAPSSASSSALGEAMTAASMADLVAAFADTAPDGWDWLIRHAPRTVPAPAGREARARTIDLAHPDHTGIAALVPGGRRVVGAWDRRYAALTGYRTALRRAGVDPLTVLPDLLHLHHTRAAGPDLDREATCLHLARAAALSLRARTAHPNTAA